MKAPIPVAKNWVDYRQIKKVLPEPHGRIGQCWSPFLQPSARHQLVLHDHGLVHRVVCLFTSQLMSASNYTAWQQRHIGANDFGQSHRAALLGQESNSQPVACNFDVRQSPPCHPFKVIKFAMHNTGSGMKSKSVMGISAEFLTQGQDHCD